MMKNDLNRLETGVFGYGQDGPAGNTGASGNSIFYSALTDENSILSAVKSGKQLSNNPGYGGSASYSAGDMVITQNSDMYMIMKDDDGYSLNAIGQFISADGPNTAAASIDSITLSSSVASRVNPYSVVGSAGLRKYMTEYAQRYIYGYTISFSTTMSGVISAKAFLRCGNGLRIAETMLDVESSSHTIFIDTMWFAISSTASELGTDELPMNKMYTGEFAAKCREYILEHTELVLECTLSDGSMQRFMKRIS